MTFWGEDLETGQEMDLLKQRWWVELKWTDLRQMAIVEYSEGLLLKKLGITQLLFFSIWDVEIFQWCAPCLVIRHENA